MGCRIWSIFRGAAACQGKKLSMEGENMDKENNSFSEAMNQVLEFWNLEPIDIETNLGSLWFTDRGTRKRYYVLLDRCAGEEQQLCKTENNDGEEESRSEGEQRKGTILPGKVLENRMEARAQKIVEVLRQDCRASLTEISRETGIPTATVFQILQRIRRHNTFSLELIPTGRKIYGRGSTEQTISRMIECLKENPRMKLTEMSERSGIPVSTLFDNMQRLRNGYDFSLTLIRKTEDLNKR